MKQKVTLEQVTSAVNAGVSDRFDRPQEVVSVISDDRLSVFVKDDGEWFVICGPA